jgi:hypothetical protein
MMSDNPREQPQTERSPLAMLGVVLFVLIVVGGCGGVFFFFTSMRSSLDAKDIPAQMSAAEKNAQVFCAQVRVGDLQAAYALGSAGFKQKVSLEALAKFADDHPTLQKPGLITLDKKTVPGGIGIPDLNADGARITMTGSLQNPDGRATIGVEMIKESGFWKVDEFECAGFRIPSAATSK